MTTAGHSALLPIVLLTVYGLLFVGVGANAPSHRATAQTSSDRSAASPIGKAQFVGSAVCAECHQLEHAEWKSSQHSVAMQEANDKTVLGQFDGTTFSHAGVTTTFYRKDGKFWVTTYGPDGQPADFEVRYTFGIAPLQQYLI